MDKKIVIFSDNLTGSGGMERINLEQERYFKSIGFDATIITFQYNSDTVFNNSYNPKVIIITPDKLSSNILIRKFQAIKSIRKTLKDIDPDYIICASSLGCVYFFYATLFTKYSYSAHIPQSIFWDIKTYKDGYEGGNLLGRYSLVFSSVYDEIRNATEGHKESIPEKPVKLKLKKRVLSEMWGISTFLGVRKADNIFVLSDKYAWEIRKMYRKNAYVLKGAYPKNISSYKQKINVRNNLNINNKTVLFSFCRLEPRKRVDLIINAFSLINHSNTVLLIGGTGSAESELKDLVMKLNIEKRVYFLGFIDEKHLYDYYYTCDVYISADHAAFGLTSYLAIGFNKKVVWTDEYDIDDILRDTNRIFSAELNAESFKKAIETALVSEIRGNIDLNVYSWENYFKTIHTILS